MLQKRFEMGQSATRVRTRTFKKKKIDFCFNQVHQMLEGHHEQQGGLEEFVRAQGGAHTAGKVCSMFILPHSYDCSFTQTSLTLLARYVHPASF